MKRITQKKLLETDPHQLASLIGGDDDIGERIWNSDDLAAILRHQAKMGLSLCRKKPLTVTKTWVGCGHETSPLDHYAEIGVA